MNKVIKKVSGLRFDLEVERHVRDYLLSKCKNDKDFKLLIDNIENYNFKILDSNFLDFFELYDQEINIFLANEVKQMSVKSIFEIIPLDIDDQLFLDSKNRILIAKFVFVQISLNIYDEVKN